MINKILNDRYQIVELIGRGGMAYVYKAKDLKLNRFVAVKVLREEYTDNAQFIKKFDRESQAAAGLSHPNIVSVFDVGVQDNIYYIIMEYVDGITLKQYLDKKGHLDYEEATQYILEIAEALKCAHEHKIIHRDIKPHNILLTKTLTPKVADFGIARAITSSTVTITNQTMGSVHYISPEQARGGFVDERSDLYSLGIMYYELLTGQLPFDEESTVSIAIKHIQEPLNPPKNLVPDLPDSVNKVVVKLTQKKPEDRYQNCDELIKDLDLMLNDFSTQLAGSNVPFLEEDDTGLFKVEPVTAPLTDTQAEAEAAVSDGSSGKKKKKKSAWVVVCILLVIAGICAVLYMNGVIFNKTVTVPDVGGMNLTDATAALKNVNLSLEVEQEVYNADVESGKIISQNPTAGSESKENKIVKVTVSKGVKTVSVPDVVGMDEDAATSALTNAKFSVDIKREYNSYYSYGEVFQMDPSASSTVQEGTKVTIYVSKGEDTVTVPGIVGLTQADAQSRLTANNLNVGTVTQSESSQYAAGVVISQDPAESTSVSKGTYINFVVSSGPASTSGTNSGTNSGNNTSGSGTGGTGTTTGGTGGSSTTTTTTTGQ
ncbi:MAG: Stk1 family PASTA domain-containing Ser/Thr kinase [Eubacteriaceae bacterium]|jgi:serine/threonine protein kinase